MYRATYAYQSQQPQYLSFAAGDKFTILNWTHKQWPLAQNGIGDVGHIPFNYIKQVEAPSEEVLKFIDGAIQAIHLFAEAQEGSLTKKQRSILEKLVRHREAVQEDFQKQQQQRENPTSPTRRPAPPPPQPSQQPEPERRQSKKRSPPPPPLLRDGSTAPLRQDSEVGQDLQSPDNPEQCQNHQVAKVESLEMQALPPPQEALADETAVPPSHQNGIMDINDLPDPPDDSATSATELLRTVEVAEDLGSQLMEEVRVSTGLSHAKCQVAVETILGYVGFKVPVLAEVMDRICLTLKIEKEVDAEGDTSHDAARLRVIISELTYCKDDSQQRSWALHEDEGIITEYLEELQSILENAKPSLCRRMFSEDSYQPVQNLVLYYQMETRVKIRLLLLKVFGGLCGLDRGVITHLLYSVLPLELAREIREHADDLNRLCYVTLVLTMIFSSGEVVPANLQEHLEEGFVSAVLELVEVPPTPGHEEEAGDMLVSLLLAFNLHLSPPPGQLSPLTQCLANRATAKVFTEKILLLMNRGDDPVRMFEHRPVPPNSVVKLIQDLCRHPSTARLFYTNDAIVLVDIILRQLQNLQPGDPVRTSHLVLVQLMLQNSDYFEHQHRLQELARCLQAIQGEESDSLEDKKTADQILQDHSQFLA